MRQMVRWGLLLGTFAILAMPSQAMALGGSWSELLQVAPLLPPPPTRVADARQFAAVDTQLQALEEHLEYYEQRLDDATELAEAAQGAADGVLPQLTDAQALGAEIQQSLAAEVQLPETALGQEDTARSAMQAALGQSADGAGSLAQAMAAMEQAVTQFALRKATRELQESRQMMRLDAEYAQADAGCQDDEACVEREARNHVQRVVGFKNTLYRTVVEDWFGLHRLAVQASDASSVAMARLAEGAAAEARQAGRGSADALEALARLRPVRSLLGALGILVSESRQRWDEASELHTQLEQ